MLRVVLPRPSHTAAAFLLAVAFAASPARAAEPATPASSASLAVFPLQPQAGVETHVSDLLSAFLVSEARQVTRFSPVVSPDQIDTLVPKSEQQQMMRCADDGCALLDMELAGGLGVTHVLAGTITRLGMSYAVKLSIINLRTAVEVAQVVEVLRPEREDDLLVVFRPVARQLFTRSGQLHAPKGNEAQARRPVRAWLFGAAGGAVLSVAFVVAAVGVTVVSGVLGAALSLAGLKRAGLYDGAVVIKGGPIYTALSLLAYAAIAAAPLLLGLGVFSGAAGATAAVLGTRGAGP